MNRKTILAALLAASSAIQANPVWADEAADLAAIRKQLNVMQHDYQAKIRSLEARLAKAERDAKTARNVAQAASRHSSVAAATAGPPEQVAQAAPPPTAPPAPADTSAESAAIPEQSPAPPPTPPTSQNAFNP